MVVQFSPHLKPSESVLHHLHFAFSLFLKNFAQLDTLTSALISCVLKAYRVCDCLHVWVFWSGFPFSAFRASGCFDKLLHEFDLLALDYLYLEIDITGY